MIRDESSYQLLKYAEINGNESKIKTAKNKCLGTDILE
jgi:hypothetical protein